ncbi:MAG: hypothetical protein WDZ28_05330 [Simkaniaceae bacterium]
MFSGIIKGAIIGAIIAFIWGFVSWMVLPWHEMSLKGFKNDGFVSWVIKENSPKHGIYVSPYIDFSKKMSKDEKSKAWDKITKKKEEGPVVFAAVLPNGIKGGMTSNLLINLLTQFVSAGLISYLLLKSNCSSYLGKVFFIGIIALIAAILVNIPYWNWWYFPTKYTIVNMADLIVTWLLAGLCMAPFVKISAPKGV